MSSCWGVIINNLSDSGTLTIHEAAHGMIAIGDATLTLALSEDITDPRMKKVLPHCQIEVPQTYRTWALALEMFKTVVGVTVETFCNMGYGRSSRVERIAICYEVLTHHGENRCL